jgi:hypothetical protein
MGVFAVDFRGRARNWWGLRGGLLVSNRASFEGRRGGGEGQGAGVVQVGVDGGGNVGKGAKGGNVSCSPRRTTGSYESANSIAENGRSSPVRRESHLKSVKALAGDPTSPARAFWSRLQANGQPRNSHRANHILSKRFERLCKEVFCCRRHSLEHKKAALMAALAKTKGRLCAGPSRRICLLSI